MKPKRVYKYNIDSKECVGAYDSIASAASEHGVSAASLSQAIIHNKDRSKPSRLISGYAWSYDADY